MKNVFESRKRRDAQTLVFFLLAWGTIMLLCGLAIDSGLLFLAKARLGRAVDGAALAAVGNFNRNSVPATNRDDVALIMRNFAVANFTDLSSIGTSGSSGTGGTGTPYTLPNGTTGTTYTYNFNDGTQDANGQYRRFVQVVLSTGSGGAITSATCNARCPVQTYFIGYATYAINGRKNVKIGGYSGPSGLVDLKVSSTAVASRNPRLIMVVIDRSGSMLESGGGASGLPPAIVQFLDFFDTSSDNIGIVSFGSAARLEMPMTTNFIIAGTNNLIDAYNVTNGVATPGLDPEDTNAAYATTGVRRLKFGGSTAADDGIRLGMEQLMANAGFNDPDVIKYMVIFTDGAWNSSRTLFAAPGYTNRVTVPAAASSTVVFLTNGAAQGIANGTDPGPWSTNLADDTNLIPMPSLGRVVAQSSLPFITNAIADTGLDPNDHTNDTWQSTDGVNEPLGFSPAFKAGTMMTVTNTTWIGTNSVTVGGKTPGQINYYTHDVDVWLQPGSAAYYYTNAAAVTANNPTTIYASDYTNPDKHIDLYVGFGGKVDLVVPGYIADGLAFDPIEMPYPDGAYPRYRGDNFQTLYMWNDSPTAPANSIQRQLMFRNYPNLLTGFTVLRADDPLGTGFEPLITEDYPPGAPRPRNGLGPYYPGAGFYWPFDLAGVDSGVNYALIDPISGDPPDGSDARHLSYSINMLSPAAAPEWSGELFYKSVSGGGTNVTSGIGNTPASSIMQSADWKVGAPPFVTALDAITGLMTNEPTHNTNIVGSPSVWRPVSFNGAISGSGPFSSINAAGASATGGYVTDGAGHYYKNTMAWSGRPTHYFDFSQGKWIAVANNHVPNIQFLPYGNWKSQEYAWHARALGVTIYTIGYGNAVSAAQCAFLATIANATNSISPGSPLFITNTSPYNPSQPIGQQFYATNSAQISNDFYSVGQAINAALTQ